MNSNIIKLEEYVTPYMKSEDLLNTYSGYCIACYDKYGNLDWRDIKKHLN